MVQVLLRTRKPSSQSREQDDHGPQADQPPLRVCGDVLPLRKRSSTRAAEGLGLSDPHVGLPLRPRPPRLPLSPLLGCTVGVAGSGAVRRAGPGLHPPLTELQTVRVWQRCAAGEAESLLLARATLGHVHGQPGCPGCVATHFWAGLGVAGLELLRGEGGFRPPSPACRSPRTPRPSPVTSPRRIPGTSCHSRKNDGETARLLHSCCCTCSRNPRKPRRWVPGKVYFHYRTWGEGRRVTLK